MNRLLVYFIGIISGCLLSTILPFVFGEVDFKLIENGRKPFFAFYHAAASDGGTVWYRGFGYALYKLNSMNEDDPNICTVGPSIAYAMPFVLINDHSNTSEKKC